MMGKHVFVIADDLTGAADAANYFRTPTHSVRVSFNPDAPWMWPLVENVVQVFDSESRTLNSKVSALRVGSAGSQLTESLGTDFLIYKKIDSTLRGHVGSEIEALLHETKRNIAVLAPSFPTNGRIVRDGKLLVNGVPIRNTPFARDPHNPVVEDQVADIVHQSTQIPTIELTHEVIARGPEAITQFLYNISHAEAIVVADAESDMDLENIAESISGNPIVLPCGSAGLAKQLAKIWISLSNDSTESNVELSVCDRVLVAVGSANPVSHRQLRNVASAFNSPLVEMRPVRLASRETYVHEIYRVRNELAKSTYQRVIGVSLAEERAERDPELTGNFESDMANLITEWSNTILANQPGSIGFVATGGDTALALCQAMSAKAIWPEGEVVSGMPWSWIETEHGKFPMISKAGGFGDDDALGGAARFLLEPYRAV